MSIFVFRTSNITKILETKKFLRYLLENLEMRDISYNFGAIRDSIMKLSASELIKESKSRTLDSFTNRIQKSSVLSKQHLIFKNLQESKSFSKERLAERFLNQNLQMFTNEKWENILRENKTLRKELLDDIHVEAKKDGKLFESINIMIESITRGGFSDFEKEQGAYEFIISHLTRQVVSEQEKSNENNDSPKLVGDAWKFVTKMAISNFNERFKHLNEEEKKAFKILISDSNTKINYFESLKRENLELIENLIKEEKDSTKVDTLNEFKIKLESIKVNHENLDDSIINCIELKQNLK